MSGLKIDFIDMTQTKSQPAATNPMLKTPSFLPFFNFNFLDTGFFPTFTTNYGSGSIDEFQKMFFNALNMMEFNMPLTEKPDNFRPLDYNRTNNTYAPDNASKIAQLQPEMQEKTMDLIEYAKNTLGKDIKITSGFRTKEQQEYLLKTTPHLAAKRSAHCEGKAVDLNIIGGTDEDYKKLGDYAKSIGMRWGGDFKKTPERWHFDYQWG